MKRREFLKYSAAGITLPFWLQNCDFTDAKYPVHFHSDHHVGHLLFQAKEWKTIGARDTEVAIVGGGIAGLAAAYQLRKKDFQLFELSDQLGGAVSTADFNGIQISQGAHYDLAYPSNYGEEVIQLLNELNLIKYEPWRKAWSFKDEQHIIPSFRKQQCYDFGKRRKDVIPESALKEQFIELMLQFEGEMKMPTRLIDSRLHHLNKISFEEYLSSELPVTDEFIRQVDYHMYDDYGGSANMVSALAGIHYFACRPYYTEDVPLFSPPRGNQYFADALIAKIDTSKIHPSHLVMEIQRAGNGYLLKIVDVQNQQVKELKAEQVIYAGQKHALKYIYPDQADLFKHEYAPWMVVNLIGNQEKGDYGFWQNEYLGDNKQFLGFIDSSVQSQQGLNSNRVFTGYYCLRPSDREYLLTIEESKNRIAQETQGYINSMLNKDIDIEACFIKVMGHAMPIPAPSYLFQDANTSTKAKMIYAGVDNGRLPLLYEALDSGLQAAALV